MINIINRILDFTFNGGFPNFIGGALLFLILLGIVSDVLTSLFEHIAVILRGWPQVDESSDDDTDTDDDEDELTNE